MSKSVLQNARNLMSRRKFGYAIRFLESNMRNYQGSSEFYLALGTSCLYIGDEGNAWKYYNMARQITVNNSELLLGQAAIFLRHGETSKALQYYLDILNIDPRNETASKALEFIRVNGNNYDTICHLKDSGKIEQFYPPVGMNPDIIRNAVFVGILLGTVVSLAIIFWPKQTVMYSGKGARADLTHLKPSEDEFSKTLDKDESGEPVIFLMDEKSIKQSYSNAIQYFQENRNNASQVEINRIKYSNASVSLKAKAENLQSYLVEETSASLDDENTSKKDNYPYTLIESLDPKQRMLYNGCVVKWRGRVSSPVDLADGSWQFELLVGLEDDEQLHLLGKVPVYCTKIPRSQIDLSKPVEILGKISIRDGKIYLDARSSWTPVSGHFYN